MASWGDACLSVAFLLILINTGKGDDPVVKITSTMPLKDPVDNYIKCPKDQDAYLTCAVTNKPVDRDVKWVMLPLGTEADGDLDDFLTPISTDLNSEDPFKFSLEKPSPTAWRLKIQNVQVTDEGRYICRVQTVSQTYVSAVADIRVTEVPLISDLQTSSNMAVKEGDSVLLRCNATGKPVPIVSWQRMAGELLPNGGEELKEYILRIPFARPEHAGYYKCLAINLAGSDSRNIQLKVKFAPRVQVRSEKVYQAVNYYKDIICYVEAYPPPDINAVTWSHSNVPIYNEGRFSILNIPGAYNRILSILTIEGVTPDDFGIYRCSASNEQGDGQATAELVASDEPTKDRTGHYRDIYGNVSSGSSAIFICVTTIIMLLSTCVLQRLSW